jgi:GNAT superfamily N-acetyltransferase
MIRTVRTNSENADFINLVAKLDNFLAEMNDREHDYYNQFNKLDSIKHVVLVYYMNVPASCGAIKEFNSGTAEIKRMFTLNEFRGKGLAKQVLHELENWAGESGYTHCILETGKKLSAAVHLYQKNGYQQIENFNQYINMENSICFQKKLK